MEFRADSRLARHQGLLPRAPQLLWHLVWQARGGSAVLLAVGEDPYTREALLLHEVFEDGEVLVGLAWEADDEGRPQRDVGHG